MILTNKRRRKSFSAVGTGKVVITATANDGSGCSDSAVVTISEPQQWAASTDTGITPASTREKPVELAGPKTGEDALIPGVFILGVISLFGMILLKRKH